MDIYRWVMFVFVIFIFKIGYADGEIHRAKATSHKTAGKSSRTQEDVAKPNTALADDMFGSQTFNTWGCAIFGSILVGLSGILPLLVIPIESGPALKHGATAKKLKLLLSFAVGGLLGDVFLHLLPEAWEHINKSAHSHGDHMKLGMWVLSGIISFLIIEKMFAKEDEFEHIQDECEEIDESMSATGGETKPSLNIKNRKPIKKSEQNGVKHKKPSKEKSKEVTIKISGWLNLFANFIDNFTHGLAIAGSFIVSQKVGMITTAAILLHEIPHEVGDFAILLRSGFNRWNAAKAQLMTAAGGLIGTLVALTAESAQAAGDRTAWILPFSSGGFIYIALVTVVPDLLEEKHGIESFKQIVCLCGGIASMALVTLVH